MSFSANVKQELSQLNNWNNKELLNAELNGYCLSSNIEQIGNKICFVTENIDVNERVQKILCNLKMKYDLAENGKVYKITFEKNKNITDIDVENIHILKAVLRGTFMASGAINNPNKKYHMEIFVSKVENAKFLNYISEQFGIKMKTLKREKNYSLYLKDGETISNFLALIGASKAMLDFEEIRVMRDIKNNVNRRVNCETANLNKIINVAVQQIDAINYLIKQNKFDELPEGLKEIANIRIENPDMSLAQMGSLLNKPIGKSGVNHRLKKILEIVDELKGKER